MAFSRTYSPNAAAPKEVRQSDQCGCAYAVRSSRIPVSVPAELVKAENPKQLASIEQGLSIENVKKFMAAAAEARAALAEPHPFSPDLRSYWSKFEILGEEMDSWSIS